MEIRASLPLLQLAVGTADSRVGRKPQVRALPLEPQRWGREEAPLLLWQKAKKSRAPGLPRLEAAAACFRRPRGSEKPYQVRD